MKPRTPKPGILTRTYMSLNHICAAALFARNASKIEIGYDGTFRDDLFGEHRSYVVGSIMTSVAFLEALANELFTDASEGETHHFQGLNETLRCAMTDMWRLQIPRTARYKVLDKFEVALVLARKPAFDRGIAPYQDASALVRLRNELVHYVPEWIPSDLSKAEDEVHALESVLHGRFALNPLTAGGNPFYPDKCLSHGCSAWAVASVLRFADDFVTRIGISPAPYEHLRSRCGTTYVAA